MLGLDPIGTHSNTPCTAMHHAEAPSAPRQSRTFPRSAAPNIVTCVPMSLMCLRSWLAIYQSGDPALQWGGIEDPFIREAAVWFVTFLAVDTVLMLLHGFGGRDLVVHHAIFFACYAAAPSSSAPIITGVLIGQEVSTPFLNVFLLLRGFKGMDSALTRAFFILFALAFFAARLVLNTYVTGRAPARLRACAPPACARRPPCRLRALASQSTWYCRSPPTSSSGSCSRLAAHCSSSGRWASPKRFGVHSRAQKASTKPIT